MTQGSLPTLPSPGESADLPAMRPQASAQEDGVAKAPAPPLPDPTRYGDWEKHGRCIDF